MALDPRNRGAQVRDAIMAITLLFWIVYGGAAVVQLLTSGAKVLESLPPFYFWGIPLAPYTALYAPWRAVGSVSAVVDTPAAPEPPIPPQPPTTPEAPR